MIKPTSIQTSDGYSIELRDNPLTHDPQIQISWGKGKCQRDLDMIGAAALRNYLSNWLNTHRTKVKRLERYNNGSTEIK